MTLYLLSYKVLYFTSVTLIQFKEKGESWIKKKKKDQLFSFVFRKNFITDSP